MAELTLHIGQIVTILIMAMALGMDAFSLGIGLGMKGIRKLDILKISLLIAIFHVIMPLMGMFMGHYVNTLLGDVAVFVGGGLLVILGAHMIYSSLRGEQMSGIDYLSAWGMLIFSLSVSIDSFSVGISLGLFDLDVIFTVLLFGLFGGIMSIVGLLLGGRLSGLVGQYGEAFGGAILLAFGIKFLF